MRTKYTTKIVIHYDDIQDLKMHLTTIREQTVQAVKSNPEEPETPIVFEGHGTDHEINTEVNY